MGPISPPEQEKPPTNHPQPPSHLHCVPFHHPSRKNHPPTTHNHPATYTVSHFTTRAGKTTPQLPTTTQPPTLCPISPPEQEKPRPNYPQPPSHLHCVPF